jgi:hypothetical protein
VLFYSAGKICPLSAMGGGFELVSIVRKSKALEFTSHSIGRQESYIIPPKKNCFGIT